MLRVNGLFGWIRSNDQRSLVLFGAFVLALQFAAALTLYLPLAGFDPAHAPFLDWGGYALRYVPLVFVAGVAVFGAQMVWHVHSVRRLVAFHFVDHTDERRLCDIVEPLAIGMGLPAPYVGVIETPAMNAFACGIRRGDAVVVVTRGLIDGLDDEELGAVVAHELAHIANGDIRLMAAANICLTMLRRLMLPNKRRPHPMVEVVTVPVLLFVMPPMFVAAILLTTLGQLSVRAGHGVRALIGASREFVADAAAVEATQNPAALVSALKRIEGRSLIAGMPPGHDAMMIDGAASGAYATHPTIAQRIKAVVAVTGSMAMIAPSRRDTRPARAGEGGGFGCRAAAGPAPAVAAPVDAFDGRNVLGLSRGATVAALAALVAFVGMRGYQYRDPLRVAAEFDPRPAVAMVVAVTRQLTCGIAATIGLAQCAKAADADMDKLATRLAGAEGAMGRMAAAMKTDMTQTFRAGDGVLSDRAPPAQIAAETAARRCFTTDGYTVGHFGLHPVIPGDLGEERFSIDRWLRSGAVSAAAVVEAAAGGVAGGAADAALADYVAKRKDRLRMVHAYFAEEGLAYAQKRFGEGDHAAAVAALRLRMRDPAYVAGLDPVRRAEVQLLVADPQAFVPCEVRAREARAAAQAAADTALQPRSSPAM